MVTPLNLLPIIPPHIDKMKEFLNTKIISSLIEKSNVHKSFKNMKHLKTFFFLINSFTIVKAE